MFHSLWDCEVGVALENGLSWGQWPLCCSVIGCDCPQDVTHPWRLQLGHYFSPVASPGRAGAPGPHF